MVSAPCERKNPKTINMLFVPSRPISRYPTLLAGTPPAPINIVIRAVKAHVSKSILPTHVRFSRGWSVTYTELPFTVLEGILPSYIYIYTLYPYTTTLHSCLFFSPSLLSTLPYLTLLLADFSLHLLLLLHLTSSYILLLYHLLHLLSRLFSQLCPSLTNQL